ncbi:phage tail sheath subtilisin-like domain-containing protein [Chloroherpeton thalassium]|uniref:phage tail sheath family protein n=1 Tax=Chloroherpeton thalassium TaxID=100716 RepID=UPI000674B8C0|nr:phage tail sheath subtilisin-like domain-containing protein [Chloroherpeton thalassium]
MEIIEVSSGLKPIREVRSAVIGLVGTVSYADTYSGEKFTEYNTPTLVRSLKEARELFHVGTHEVTDEGVTSIVSNVSYSSILESLESIFAQGACTVLICVMNGSDFSAALTGFEESISLFGFEPKILIAPGFSHKSGILSQMLTAADKHKAVALVDVASLDNEKSTTDGAEYGGNNIAVDAAKTAVISGAFNTSDERCVLCYPRLLVAENNTTAKRWYSAFLAGVIANKDAEQGYWWSPSNTEINGILGLEQNISAGLSDANSDANSLNENGIVSVFAGFGTGYRTWGNRSAAYPASTAPHNFINGRRVSDVLLQSVQQAGLQFVDRPITDALIDSIKASVNAFIRSLVGRGALIDGECVYNAEDSTPADGHLIFGVNYMFPPPAERITIQSYVDINLLSTVGE